MHQLHPLSFPIIELLRGIYEAECVEIPSLSESYLLKR